MTRALGALFGDAFAVLIIGILVGYQIGATGYVGQQIWAWYVLPLWPTLPALTWKHFFVAGALKRLAFGSHTPQTDGEADKKNAGWKLLGLAIGPWVVLFIAWWIR